ncbi:tail fiber assembly protein [Escherichia coli]|nr:tail fiber assembly protein [Escherichia coli]
MNEYVYSARHNAFFPVDMIDKYKSVGWDLSDAKEVNQNIVSEFMVEPPQGKVRIAGEDGLPMWADIAPPTHEELIEITESERQLLINQANEYMNSKQWPGKAAIGRLKGDELAQYNLWLDYLDALELIDTSGAPDIEWPTPPAVQAR